MSELSNRKIRVLEALVRDVDHLLAETTASQKAIVAGATHEESRAENDKDTRGLESSYLARGLAKRVLELRQAKGVLMSLRTGPSPRVGLGSLLTVEDEEGEARTFFVAPAGGGMQVDVDGVVTVVTPRSPLARGLMGREEGDDAVLVTPKGKQSVDIVHLE